MRPWAGSVCCLQCFQCYFSQFPHVILAPLCIFFSLFFYRSLDFCILAAFGISSTRNKRKKTRKLEKKTASFVCVRSFCATFFPPNLPRLHVCRRPLCISAASLFLPSPATLNYSAPSSLTSEGSFAVTLVLSVLALLPCFVAWFSPFTSSLKPHHIQLKASC